MLLLLSIWRRQKEFTRIARETGSTQPLSETANKRINPWRLKQPEVGEGQQDPINWNSDRSRNLCQMHLETIKGDKEQLIKLAEWKRRGLEIDWQKGKEEKRLRNEGHI